MAARSSEAIARTMSGVLGAAAVVAVVLIALLTSDKGPSGLSGPNPGSQLPGAGLPGAAGNGGGVAVGGGSGGSSGGGSTSKGKADTADLRAHFPLPPGAVRVTVRFAAPDEKDYRVHSTLAAVKAFYETTLGRDGVEWSPTTTTTTSTGTVTAWHGGLYADGSPPLNGFLTIDADYVGLVPGTVLIQVTIDE